MSLPTLNDIEQFLRNLEATQKEFLKLYRHKRTALKGALREELLKLTQREVELARILQALLGHRNHMLQQAKQHGVSAQNLSELIQSLDGIDREAILTRIERAQKTADELRFESGIHWLILVRAHNHHREVLDLIAHRGRKAPTYSRGPNTDTVGGAILDASI